MRLKATIIQTLDRHAVVIDADTGRSDADRRRDVVAIRLLERSRPAPPEPTDEEVETAFIESRSKRPFELTLGSLENVMTDASTERARDVARRLLVFTFKIDEADADALIDRGKEYVVKYYCDQERARLREIVNARWLPLKSAWEADERRRRASLALWAFRDKVVEVEGWATASRDEIVTLVRHEVLSEEGAFEKMRQRVEQFLDPDCVESQRQAIPEHVRSFVWRRDDARCTKCGSRNALEFDHIIPVSEGGSNTARNIELLCERCNRTKGARI